MVASRTIAASSFNFSILQILCNLLNPQGSYRADPRLVPGSRFWPSSIGARRPYEKAYKFCHMYVIYCPFARLTSFISLTGRSGKSC
eukprot:12731828-Ditylum_brightwellii.AAC.1